MTHRADPGGEESLVTMTAKSAFITALESRWQQQLFLCVGLDPRYDLLPERFASLSSAEETVVSFNTDVVDATHDPVCAYKPNIAYYEVLGEPGHRALTRTVRYIKDTYPAIPVILDAKRGDIGETSQAYAQAVFDVIGADAVTVHPYLGQLSLAPFLERGDKGIIVMGANSNPGAGEFQDLSVGPRQEPLYRYVSRQVAAGWNRLGNCSLTVGATEPHKIAHVRSIVGDMPLLILGIGAQKGGLAAAVHAGQNSDGQGMIISVSRAILYATNGSDVQDSARSAAMRLTHEINHVLAG